MTKYVAACLSGRGNGVTAVVGCARRGRKSSSGEREKDTRGEIGPHNIRHEISRKLSHYTATHGHVTIDESPNVETMMPLSKIT